MKKIIMFAAEWCGPCNATKPHFLALKDTMKDVEYQLVDVDDDTPLAEKYSIRAVPTFILLKDDVEIARISGGTTAQKLKDFITQ